MGKMYYDLPLLSPVCTYCAHWQDEKPGRVCKAFVSIPPEIWLGEHDHTTPYPGDHGVRFERVEVKKPEEKPSNVVAFKRR